MSFYKNMYFNRIQHIKIKKINLKKQALIFFHIFFKKACTKQKLTLSLHSQNKSGTIAQLVEQRTENPCVPGSIPGGTTQKDLKFTQNFRSFCISHSLSAHTTTSHRKKEKLISPNFALPAHESTFRSPRSYQASTAP